MTSYWWLILALISAVAYAASAVATSQLTKKHKFVSTAVTASYHVVGILGFLAALMIGLPYNLGKNAWSDLGRAIVEYFPYMILISIAFFIGDAALAEAYKTAPNPGYCGALSDLSLVLTTLLPVIVYGVAFHPKQLIGVVLAIVSLYLIGQ